MPNIQKGAQRLDRLSPQVTSPGTERSAVISPFAVGVSPFIIAISSFVVAVFPFVVTFSSFVVSVSIFVVSVSLFVDTVSPLVAVVVVVFSRIGRSMAGGGRN